MRRCIRFIQLASHWRALCFPPIVSIGLSVCPILKKKSDNVLWLVVGFIAGVSKGVLRALRLQLNSVGDIIPVDFPINLMITAAWYTATYRPNSIMVYNCTSGLQNPITWGQIRAQLVRSILKFPSSDIMWYPTTSVQYDEVTFNSTSCKQFADNFFCANRFCTDWTPSSTTPFRRTCSTSWHGSLANDPGWYAISPQFQLVCVSHFFTQHATNLVRSIDGKEGNIFCFATQTMAVDSANLSAVKVARRYASLDWCTRFFTSSGKTVKARTSKQLSFVSWNVGEWTLSTSKSPDHYQRSCELISRCQNSSVEMVDWLEGPFVFNF